MVVEEAAIEFNPRRATVFEVLKLLPITESETRLSHVFLPRCTDRGLGATSGANASTPLSPLSYY
jgi:hypothetical protein